MVLAHIAGVPLEELALTGAGAGTVLLVARAWVEVRPREQLRRRGDDRSSPTSA